MLTKDQILARKVAAEIRRQEVQENYCIESLLQNVNDVQGMVNDTRRVFERTEIFEGRELVLSALNVLNTRIGIARMRRHLEGLTENQKSPLTAPRN